MSLALGVMTLALLVLIGLAPARFWGPALVGDHRAGSLALSLSLGALIAGLLQVAFVALGWPARGELLVLLALVSLVLGRRRWPAATPVDAGAGDDAGGGAVPPEPAAALERSHEAVGSGGVAAVPTVRLGVPLTLLLTLVAGLALLVTTALPFSGDGSKFWAPKARDLALSGALDAPSLVADGQLGFHRNYPLLVPALLAPVFGLGPPDAHVGPKLVLGGLLVALLVLVSVLLARRSRGLAASLLTVPLLVAPETGASIGAGGYVDGVLALWLVLAALAVEALRRGGRARDWAPLAALAVAGLLSTKLEGGVAAVLLAGAWLLVGPRRGALPAVALGALALCLPTLWLRLQIAGDPAISDPSQLLDGGVLAARSVPLLVGLASAFGDVAHLGLAPLAIVLAARRGARSALWPWLAAGLLAFLAVVYLSTTMHLGRHLQTSLPRLVFQWLPTLALLACATGAPDKQRAPGTLSSAHPQAEQRAPAG